jgi:hypothetical protein
MTIDEFRELALRLPEAVESSHMGHPDFRVRGKIFATLMYPDQGLGMVKVTPEQQCRLVATAPTAFAAVNGGWGRRGCTQVILAAATEDLVRPALDAAWRNVAPKRLAQQHDIDELV